MTTLLKTSVQCFVCGKTSEHTEVGSYYQAVGPDLDTRPGEMGRSTMEYWIQECPFCGHCAPEISKGQPDRVEIVRSEAYQTRLRRDEYPRLANRFLCWALVQETAGNFVDAGWASLHGAWALDDVAEDEASNRCRVRAAELFEKAIAAGQTLMEQDGGTEALLTDLWRRAGHFEKAKTYAGQGKRIVYSRRKARYPHRSDLSWDEQRAAMEAWRKSARVMLKVLDFEQKLIRGRDSLAHTVAEALEWQKPRRQ